MSSSRVRLVLLGSGAFGIATFEAMMHQHDVALVITQPDRPAGRRKRLTATPIAACAERHGIATLKPEDVNTAPVVQQVRDAQPSVIAVIAYGQKIGPQLRAIAPMINLHGSLLPKYRGAAPINWAMINGEPRAGVSVIDVVERMDAGAIYGSAATVIDPMETAGQLHDRLAELGSDLMLGVLAQIAGGTAKPVPQDEQAATRAPKLSRAHGWISFDQPASRVRATIHGLTPWPGCTVELGRETLKLLRVRDVEAPSRDAAPGTILDGGLVACSTGAVELLSVQPPGGTSMSFEAYRRGRHIEAGSKFTPIDQHSGRRA